jgi:hypothetical protein
MHVRRVLVACVLLVGALASSRIFLASAAASPQSVVLHTSDLPKGFKVSSETTYSNAQIAKIAKLPKAQFDQHGRITGVHEVLKTTAVSGIIQMGSDAHLYKTSAGAAWDWKLSHAKTLTQAKPASAPKVGDSSAGFQLLSTSGGRTYAIYGIDLQFGVYDMTVVAAGLKGSFSMNDIARYAKIMVSRAH